MIPSDLELCREAGLTDEQAERVIATSYACDLDTRELLQHLLPALQSMGAAVAEAGKVFAKASDRPDFAAILREPPQNRSDRRSERRQEHRARSMHKPTGKPWDKRRER